MEYNKFRTYNYDSFICKGVKLEDLYEYYETLDNEKLQRIAMNEAKDLTPEAVEVLIDVLIARGFDESFINNVKVQREEFSNEDILELAEKFANSGCPICGKPGRINAIELTEVISFIIFSDIQNKVVIGCQDCLGKLIWKANDKTSLWGWWSTSGLFNTPKALFSNRENFSILNESFGSITDVIIDYVKRNTGYVLNTLSYQIAENRSDQLY